MAARYTLTSRDVQAINSTSARLGIRPEDLTAVMMYETIGTMNPDIVGGKNNKYQGLIQFGPHERRAYGYTKGMSFAEQVEGPVYRYLADRGIRPGMDLGRIYRTVNGGNPNARLTKNDGNGTIAQHIARIKADFLPQAQATLQAIPAGPNMDAIMDVASRNLAPGSVPDERTAAMGFAPDLAESPAQMAIANVLAGGQPELTPDQIDQMTMVDASGNYVNQPPPSPPPFPDMPPQWASAQGFPIDEALSGRSGQDVLTGGPRMDPRHAGPATGMMAPGMLSMQSPADVLDAGPRLRPGGAPSGADIPDPLSRLLSGVTPPPPLSMAMPTPRPRASGLPNPPDNPRRDPFGFPIDVNRPRLNNGDGTFSTEQTITFDASEVGLPSEIVTIPTIINGQKVSDQTAMAAFARGLNPAVQSGFTSFDEADRAAEARTNSIAAARATNGERNFPSLFGVQPPFPGSFSPPAPFYDPLSSANPGIKIPGEFRGNFVDGFPSRPPRPPMASREMWDSMGLGSRGTPETQMSVDASARGLFQPPPNPYDDPSRQYDTPGPRTMSALGMGVFEGDPLRPQLPPAPPPPQQVGNLNYPSLPTMRLPQTQAAVSEPGMGLGPYGMTPPRPGPFFVNADSGPTFTPPPKMAQDAISSVFGAPPAQATPPNLAIPFSEVAGSSPASAANLTSPLPKPDAWGDQSQIPGRFDDAFGPTPVSSTSIINPAQIPPPASTPDQWESYLDNGATDLGPPTATAPPPPSFADAQANAARTQNAGRGFHPFGIGAGPGAFGRRLGPMAAGAVGGPIGAAAGGLLGFLAARNPPKFTGNGRSGVGINSSTGGAAPWQHGTAGNMNAMQYQTSDGRTIVTAVDPFTGQTLTGYG